MSIFIPIFAAVLQAGSCTLDKIILSMKRVTDTAYIAVSFPLTFLFTLVIFCVIRPPFSAAMFSGITLVAFLASIAIFIATNAFYYRALDGDGLGEVAMLDLLRNLPVIVFSALLFSDERNAAVLVLACVATAALIWSHWEHHNFKIRKRTRPFLVWTLSVAALGAPLSKIVLATWDPVSFELVRSGFAAILFGGLFFQSARQLTVRSFALLMLTNGLTTVAWILYFFSFQKFGIVMTVLLFSLQPLLVYAASIVLLKEKIQPRKMLAFAVILLSISVSLALR